MLSFYDSIARRNIEADLSARREAEDLRPHPYVTGAECFVPSQSRAAEYEQLAWLSFWFLSSDLRSSYDTLSSDSFFGIRDLIIVTKGERCVYSQGG